MTAERFDFANAQGEKLAALLDRPDGPIRAVALFAHCFTCGKDNKAARLIAHGLTSHGIAVLRFDFTGLGSSEGEFANTTFSSNIDDLVAAADHLRMTIGAPGVLIGHSLGGAAVLAAAHRIAEARAVVTVAAPFDPAHVAGLFGDRVDEIESKGEIEVTLVGRPFRIRRALLADIAGQNLTERIVGLRKALLVFHSPTDETVGIDNASRIFTAAKHPKSFISLAGADHLLRRPSDAAYVAHVVAAWAERYLDMAATTQPGTDAEPHEVLVRETRHGTFQQEITAGTHRFLADEPVAAGGLDSGPGPYDLLLAALGACTSMTLRLYAERKKLPLARTKVRLRHSRIYASRLCRMRNQGRDARPHRADHYARRRARRRRAQAVNRNRRQMSGTSHADVGDQYPNGGGISSGRGSLNARTRRRDRLGDRCVIAWRHDVDAGDAANGRKLFDQFDANMQALACGIGGLFQPRDEVVGNDGAVKVVFHPARRFCRAQRIDADQERKLARDAGFSQRGDIAAHDGRIHAELGLRELRPGLDLGEQRRSAASPPADRSACRRRR